MKKKIYIVLTYTGTWLSRLIKIFSKKEYSHSSIGLDLELYELYSFGRTVPRNPFSGGFVNEDPEDGTFKLFNETNAAIYSLEVTDEEYIELKKYIESFKNSPINYKFNLFGIISAGFNKPLNRNTKYFCSQFVASALYSSGVYDFKKDIGVVSPMDLKTIPNLELVYEGKLRDYRNFIKKNRSA